MCRNVIVFNVNQNVGRKLLVGKCLCRCKKIKHYPEHLRTFLLSSQLSWDSQYCLRSLTAKNFSENIPPLVCPQSCVLSALLSQSPRTFNCWWDAHLLNNPVLANLPSHLAWLGFRELDSHRKTTKMIMDDCTICLLERPCHVTMPGSLEWW